MKKYILILSIAIIAVLNFTLVKSKTGNITLKSLTELAQANADETVITPPPNPTPGQIYEQLVNTTTIPGINCEDYKCTVWVGWPLYKECGETYSRCTHWYTEHKTYARWEWTFMQDPWDGNWKYMWNPIASQTYVKQSSLSYSGSCPAHPYGI